MRRIYTSSFQQGADYLLRGAGGSRELHEYEFETVKLVEKLPADFTDLMFNSLELDHQEGERNLLVK